MDLRKEYYKQSGKYLSVKNEDYVNVYYIAWLENKLKEIVKYCKGVQKNPMNVMASVSVAHYVIQKIKRAE